ncbi:MAG: hypothetical protein IT423_22585 [Pirellulaceae bacterium]|nr:hypothetical protein [Pirellulaceae bacterium]
MQRVRSRKTAKATYTRCFMEVLESRCMLAGVEISGQEQLLLELVNRARANPLAEVARYGIDLNTDLAPNTITSTPKQPLAPNQALANAARLYSQDMINRDFFAHFDPSGKGPADRLAAAGYVGRGWGENIAWAGSEAGIDPIEYIGKNHEGLIRSAPHRTNIMKENFDELGTGVDVGIFTSGGKNYNTSMVTEDFGISQNLVFITGVAYNDAVRADQFYSVGEGLGGVLVKADRSDGTTFQTQTGSSGGYSLAVPAGSYTITFSGGGLVQPVNYLNIVIQDANQKVDLNTSRIAALSVTLDRTTASESVGFVTATLRRSGFVSEAINVTLLSDRSNLATVPASITFPAGVDSVTFPITIANDSIVGGGGTALISAIGSGTTAASAQLTVTEDDLISLTLVLTIGTVKENDGQIAATVSRGTANPTALIVSLASNDTSAATVPAQIEIAAGRADATFTISIFDDAILDGSQLAKISASAIGAVGANVILTVLDNETGSRWTNPRDSLDINDDRVVTALDALLIINQINLGHVGVLGPGPVQNQEYVDASGDGFLTAIDALLVINRLNRGSGEAELYAAVDEHFAAYVDVDAFVTRRRALAAL